MFLFDERFATFEMFSLTHLIPVLLTLIAVVLIGVFRKNLQNAPRFDRIFRIVFAVVPIAMELIFYAWALDHGPPTWNMLPFGLCTMSMYLTAIALLSHNDRLSKVVYPWAVAGALLSLIVAELSYDVPHFRYFHYFGNHSMFLIANVYMVATSKTPFTYRHLMKSCAILFSIVVPLYFLNGILGTNHMYLAELPAEVAFLFEWMGSPWWLFGLGFAIFLLFHLVSLPFLLRRKSSVEA